MLGQFLSHFVIIVLADQRIRAAIDLLKTLSLAAYVVVNIGIGYGYRQVWCAAAVGIMGAGSIGYLVGKVVRVLDMVVIGGIKVCRAAQVMLRIGMGHPALVIVIVYRPQHIRGAQYVGQ